MAENSKARGANFTGAELNQLCASWLHVSQDPIVGSAQKLGSFWDRTLKHYNDNRPNDREARNTRSLETKWSELKRDVARFAGCFKTVEDADQSGTSFEDTIRKSKELYVVKDPKGKSFLYSDQWLLLRNCPRFSGTVDDMIQKAAQKKARKQKGKSRHASDKENDCPNVENVIHLDPDEPVGEGQRGGSNSSSESLHFGEERPVGNKAAKKARADARADESSSKIMAAAQRDMAIICARRLKLAEKQDRETLLTLKVADIDPECQEYFRLHRAKELRIAMFKLQREEEEEMAALTGTRRTPLPFARSISTSVPNNNAAIPIPDPAAASNSEEFSPNDAANDFADNLTQLDRELASD